MTPERIQPIIPLQVAAWLGAGGWERSLNPGYLYLALHIAGSVSFGHVMKWALRRNLSLVGVGAVNYAFAAGFSLLWALVARGDALTTDAAAVGLLGGVSYVVSFYFYYQAIRLTGVSVSTAVVRLSVLPAVAASLLFWGERLSLYQVAGIVLILLALPLLSQQPGDRSAKLGGPVWGWILALYVATGGGPLAARLYQQVGTPSGKPYLLAVWFGAAAVVAFLTLGFQRLRPTRADLALGVLLGAVNVAANFGLLAALEHLPGAIVFPAASGSGVLLVAVTNAVLWGERPSRPALVGVAIAIPALVLANLP